MTMQLFLRRKRKKNARKCKRNNPLEKLSSPRIGSRSIRKQFKTIA